MLVNVTLGFITERHQIYTTHMALEFSVDAEPSSYGHHFIVGLSGTTLSDSDKRMLSALRPAGILLLKRNFNHAVPYDVWLNELRELIASVKSHTEREDIIISLDHEGQRVMRTPPPLTVFPNAQKFAKRSAEVATAHARELRTLGVNLSWAPVADVHSNPKNPIIGERAFGDSPQAVCQYASEYLIALEKEGILGCAKHFPGHGDTSTDSHLELPVVNITEEELWQRELPPFKALIDAGVSFVMTAHILYPKIDPTAPATMSPKILDGILRKRMNFDGVVVSDDLDMHAVAARFSASPDATIQAVNSGCDMFIVARHHPEQEDRATLTAKFMGEAITSGAISEARLFEAFNRINTVFEARLENHSTQALSPTVLASHQRLAAELA